MIVRKLVPVAVIGLLAACGGTAGTVPTVTKTVAVPGPTVTKTVPGPRVTVPAPPERIVEGVPCFEQGGHVFLFDVNPGPKPPATFCHLVPRSPASSADFTVVAADGTRGGTYTPVGSSGQASP